MKTQPSQSRTGPTERVPDLNAREPEPTSSELVSAMASIAERASAKTQVLNEIAQIGEHPPYRFWGINE
jgi:hypothetical protein